ncbi:MAG TPA: hypothetical protein VM537_13400, partial [Anaerolineae bacterium]|nr:hypothetical protein [Anaerolineae bacterium]
MHISQEHLDALVARGLTVSSNSTHSPSSASGDGHGSRVDLVGKIVITVSGKPMAKPRMTQRHKWAGRDCVK